jgi:HEAT repeat protein
MTPWRKSRIGLLLAIAALAVALGYAGRNWAPVARDAKLGVWLRCYDGPSPAEDDPQAPARRADEAIRKMGPAVAPTLLRLLETRDTRFARWTRLVTGTLDEGLFFKGTRASAGVWRRRATWGFRALGEQGAGAIPELERLLDHPEFSLGASESLVWLGPKAAPVLIKALENRNAIVREQSARALRLGFTTDLYGPDSAGAPPGSLPRRAIEKLAGGLKDPDPNVCSACAWALGQIGLAPELVVPALIAELRNARTLKSQGAMATALGQYGERAREAVPVLSEMLQSNRRGNGFTAAASSLAGIGLDGMRPLTNALATAPAEARRSVATALGAYSDFAFPWKSKRPGDYATVVATVLPALEAALSDPDATARGHSRSSLARFSMEYSRVVPLVAGGLREKDPNRRLQTAYLLAEFKTNAIAAIPELSNAASNDSSGEVRATALSAMRAIEPYFMVPPGGGDR